MKGWTETQMEYRQRLTDDAWAFRERLDRDAGYRASPHLPKGTVKLEVSHVSGNDTYYRVVPKIQRSETGEARSL